MKLLTTDREDITEVILETLALKSSSHEDYWTKTFESLDNESLMNLHAYMFTTLKYTNQLALKKLKQELTKRMGLA